MCRRKACSGPITTSTTPMATNDARAKRHQCQRRWTKITACPSSQAMMESGENQTSTSMTSNKPLAAG
jgi:GTP cyclohydrolase FolE2